MSHRINPVSPCGGCGETWGRWDKPCYSLPGLPATASASSPPLGWAGAAPVGTAQSQHRSPPAPQGTTSLYSQGFALQGFREDVPQTGDAAPSFSVQVWQTVAQSLASLRTGLSHRKFNTQKFRNYLPFWGGFFTAKNTNFPARSLTAAQSISLHGLGVSFWFQVNISS